MFHGKVLGMEFLKQKLKEFLIQFTSLGFYVRLAGAVGSVMAAQEAGLFPPEQLTYQLVIGVGLFVLGLGGNNGQALLAKKAG